MNAFRASARAMSVEPLSAAGGRDMAVGVKLERCGAATGTFVVAMAAT